MSTQISEMMAFAIERERSAAAFYDGLAKLTDNPAMQAEFSKLATQERGHLARLERAQESEEGLQQRTEVVDLRLSDYLVGVEPTPGMSYDELLVLAIHREQQALALYTDMAAKVADGSFKKLLLALAKEEASHKHKFEVEFNDVYLAQN